MEKLLVILDASALSNSACMLKLFRTVIQGYTSKLQNNDMEFGTAFHKFRKVFRDKGEEGLALGIKEAKNYFNKPMVIKSNKKYLTTTFLIRICLEYAEKYKKDQFDVIRIKDNEPLLELKFIFPYYIDDVMEILIAGTIDELGKHRSGIVCICDAKTTSMWDIKKYFESYELSCQLRFYKWALLKYIKAYPDSFLAELCNGNEIGCFIDGIFYKGEDKEVIYQRSDVMLYGDDKEMLEMNSLIETKIAQLILAIQTWRNNSITPLREGILIGACETKYDHCTFAKVCAAVDSTTRDVMLDYGFIKRQYNPMTHGE